MTRLLIVDDSPLMRKLLVEIFTLAGDFEVAVARNGEEALAQLSPFAPDVVTLDIHMPGMDGLACLDRIMIERPCPVVMLSSLTEAGADETLEALALGAVDFIAKPKGAISIEIDAITELLVDKVRGAAQARISRTARLADRVRLRAGASAARRALRPNRSADAKARSARRPSALHERPNDVAAVVVGVSTGGPPALDALLEPLPADFPWPILIAQHMPASFTGPLARRLDRNCALTVVEVTAPTPIAPGHVYIGRGDADLIVARRRDATRVLPAPSDPAIPWHPSADRLADSAIDQIGPERLIGVLMTGMGSDGARAMARIKQEGGHVIAQDADTSVVWGMPGALVAMDGANEILPLPDIAGRLIDWARE